MMQRLFSLFLMCLATVAQAQYSETFSIPEKGYLANFENDFSQVNWSLSTWDLQPPAEFGRDEADYFKSNAAGQLECIDLDQEVCWLSPDLTATTTGNIAFTADLAWDGLDNNQTNPLEFINVEYQLNGGAWVRHPNVIGAEGDPLYTVRYIGTLSGNNGSVTTNFPSIAVTTGDAMNLRICVSTNANAESVRIDNVNVSVTSKVLSLQAPELKLQVLPNPFSTSVTIGWEMPARGAALLEIIDLQGKVIYSRNTEDLAGRQEWFWPGTDLKGASVPSGVYMLKLSGAGWQQTQKLVHD